MAIKNKVLIALFALSLISIGLIVYMVNKNNTKTPSPTTSTGADYNSLVPGKSTEDSVIKTMGTAVNETQNGNTKTLEYKSTNPNFNNQFSVTSGTLSFVKQIVTLKDNIKVPDINKKYGNYTNILYGPSSSNGFNLYVYPSKGVAYIGNQGSEIVFEIWYFPPTDIKTFESLYAQDYSETFSPHP